MCDKMAISAYILKIVENDPCLRLQMTAKKIFNSHQFFSTNRQYVKINPVAYGILRLSQLRGGGGGGGFYPTPPENNVKII